jgi:hypothetical protein
MPIPYSDFRPTQFDHPITIEDRNDWLVAPVIRNRDSGILTESNWECQLDSLELVTAEYEIHSFGHWANGWFEIVLVHPDYEDVLEEVEAALIDYPILDETHYANLEWDIVHEYWNKMRLKDRIALCRSEGASIFSARHDLAPAKCFERIQYWVNEE